MGEVMISKKLVSGAILLLFATSAPPCSVHAATPDPAQSTEAILQRLDALEKRSARLEKLETENAVLRQRVRNLERSGRTLPASDPLTSNVPPALASAAGPVNEPSTERHSPGERGGWRGGYWGASFGAARTRS